MATYQQDPINITGMGGLLNPGVARPGISFVDLETQIVNGDRRGHHHHKPLSTAEKFERELAELNKAFGVDLGVGTGKDRAPAGGGGGGTGKRHRHRREVETPTESSGSDASSSAESSGSGSSAGSGSGARESDRTRSASSRSRSTRCSATSRSATTGFLSLSRSTEMGVPEAMSRARCAATSTSSKRFGTFITQSSTVTRAISQDPTNLWEP